MLPSVGYASPPFSFDFSSSCLSPFPSSQPAPPVSEENSVPKKKIFAFEPPEGLCLPILHAMLRLSVGQVIRPVFSAIFLPNRPNTIFIECNSEESALNLLKHISHIGKIPKSLTEIAPSQFPNVFFNPVKSLRYNIGKIVSIRNPEFNADSGQIVDIEPNKGRLLVKHWPRIDYAELNKRGLYSQKKLNEQMPNNYKPPIAPFAPNKLFPGNRIVNSTLKIWDLQLDTILWDEHNFIGEFQYSWFPFNDIKLLQKVDSDVYAKFRKGLATFESNNMTFVNNMSDKSEHGSMVQLKYNPKILPLHYHTGKPKWLEERRSHSASIPLEPKKKIPIVKTPIFMSKTGSTPVKTKQEKLTSYLNIVPTAKTQESHPTQSHSNEISINPTNLSSQKHANNLSQLPDTKKSQAPKPKTKKSTTTAKNPLVTSNPPSSLPIPNVANQLQINSLNAFNQHPNVVNQPQLNSLNISNQPQVKNLNMANPPQVNNLNISNQPIGNLQQFIPNNPQLLATIYGKQMIPQNYFQFLALNQQLLQNAALNKRSKTKKKASTTQQLQLQINSNNPGQS